ncbi:MAG: DUF4330 domain-containing protein [Epulopiscium sp.]|jgi:hypothetical protein|nr:DUF4330 domain-containing protein [Candidatus Epulonipiscium sp.]
MKLVNEKGKLFGKINIIDFCVILLVIALALGAAYKFRGLEKTSTTTTMEPIRYTIEVKKIRDYIFQNVKEGDLIFDKTSGNCIGTITKIDATPAKEAVLCIDGTYNMGDVENRIDVVFTVEGEGVISADGYFINKTYELVSGSERKFMTKYFECDGSIKDILE